jgi:L-threonylcarbamoyladenylate synthase
MTTTDRRGIGPRVLRAGDSGAVAAAIDALRSGRLVAVPTETVYGLACALDRVALGRLLEAKRRSPGKGITVLVDSIEQAAGLAVLSPAARLVAERFWPGPLTMVLAGRTDVRLPGALTGGTGAVGVRMPDHPVPRALARALGPLPTTSANVSGEPDAITAEDVVDRLGACIDVILDDGPSPGRIPSTVVSLSPQGDLRLLRPGAVPFPLIREAVVAAIGRAGDD